MPLSLPSYLSDQALSKFIAAALAEDLGEGDHTTLAIVPDLSVARVQLLVKDTGILAGVELARKIYKQVDPAIQLGIRLHDGDPVHPGDIAFIAEGRSRTLLSTERLILNCMQRMSGIATHTRRLCEVLEGTQAKLMDTRKTTPNFRLAEKWAVSIGGGINHRFGLYDKIMIKDNHIDVAGGIGPAVRRVKEYLRSTGRNLEVEVETRSLQEVEEALAAGGVDIIMLDNMPVDLMRAAVDRIGGACRTEASGGINESNLREVALTGVDYISIGALTHTIRSLDLSLKVIRG